MSGYLSGLVWKSTLHKDQKYILLALADHAQDDGTDVYPSIRRTALKVGMAERTVQRHIKRFIRTGVLEVVQKAGYRQPVKYRIWIDKLTFISELLRVTPATEKGDIDDMGRVTLTTEKGDTGDMRRVTPATSAYKVLDVKETSEETSGRREGKSPPLNPLGIASEKARAALVEVQDQIKNFRTTGTGLTISDRISVSVITNDLGGKDAALKMGDELAEKFTRHYVRRELAAYHAGRRA